MMKRRAIPMALLALAGLAVAAPAPADAAVSDAAIIALNSIEIERASNVTGDVVVNVTDPAPNHGPTGADLQVDKDTTITGDLYAETVVLSKGVTTGAVFDGASYAPPIFQPLPAFRGASFDASQAKPDVFVAEGTTEVLAAGQYGTITIEQDGTLELTGGYDVDAVEAVTTAGGNCPFPCRTIRFSGATQLRVAGTFDIGTFASIEAASGSFARDFVAYIGGTNADPADPNSRPAAATIGRGSTAAGNFYVPAGTFHLERQSELTGSVIAFDAGIDREATIVLDSAFNFAPLADALTVTTSNGAASFSLTGSDVDGDTLTFTLVSGPSVGILGGLPASDAADPTATVAVTYSGGTDGVADQFVFQVDDGKGGTDTAVVDINPSDDPPDPPDLTGILAKDDSLEVIQGAQDVPITLVAAAPIAPQPNPIGDLFFTIFTGPDLGGSVTTPVSNPGTPVRSADVEYTPLATFTGTETFVFQACEVDAPTNCDQGTVTINVQATAAPDPPVALDQSVTTQVDASVTINLVSPANTAGDPEGRSCTGNSQCADGFICDDGSCVPSP